MAEPGEVKAARNRAGLTQQQLADILGVHVKTLRDYEKGKRTRLRAGTAKLADFIAAHPEPQKTPPPVVPVAPLRPLAEATDMELIAVLTARLAMLRAAVDGPIPLSVEASAPTVVMQTVVAPGTNGAVATGGVAGAVAPPTSASNGVPVPVTTFAPVPTAAPTPGPAPAPTATDEPPPAPAAGATSTDQSGGTGADPETLLQH